MAQQHTWLRALPLALLLAACGGKGEPGAASDAPPSLAGTSWVLEDPPHEGPRPVTLAFSADGQASGFAGVNTFRGSYEAVGEGSLHLGPLATTRMAGPEPAMEIEQAVLAGLESTRAYRVREGKLELLEGEQVLLTFRKGD